MNNCEVIEDLWPLYLDGEVQESTRAIIEQHISECTHCQSLREMGLEAGVSLQGVELSGLQDELEPGSPEKFLMRLKRRRQAMNVLILLSLVLMVWAGWTFGGFSASRAYRQQVEASNKFFQEQLVALQEVSPESTTVLEKLGIKVAHGECQVKNNSLNLALNMTWQLNSLVDGITVVQKPGVLQDPTLLDEEGGTPISLSTASFGGTSSTAPGSTGVGRMDINVKGNLPKTIPKALRLKLPPFYAFLKEPNPEEVVLFDYPSDEGKKSLNKTFTYMGISFRLMELELGEKEFVVRYEQLTPAREGGVLLLNFEFDDRLGNTWGNREGVNLQVGNPKEFRINRPSSPSKHWKLRVKNAVQVIPGFSTSITVPGGGTK